MPLRPRVMLVTNELHRGGAETQILRLSTELLRRGVEIDVVSIVPPQAYVDELTQAGAHVHVLAPTLEPKAVIRAAIPALVQVLRARRPDVLVGFLFHASNLVRLVGRGVGVPAVITSVRSDSFGGARRDHVERAFKVLRTDDLVVTNSSLVRERLLRDGLVTPARVMTIGNAIDTSQYTGLPAHARRELRRSLGVDDGAFLWLAIARYNPVKDHATMLRAVATARTFGAELRPPLDVALRVAGAGHPDAAWHELRRELSLEDTAVWAGTRRDIPRFLQAGDGLVLSSRHEGLPNAIMEAFAAGLPVVSTDVGGVRELLEPGVSGELVAPGQAGPLGEAMAGVMTKTPTERARMGAAGRAHVQRQYHTAAVADRWLEAFDLAIARGRRRLGVRLSAALRSRFKREP